MSEKTKNLSRRIASSATVLGLGLLASSCGATRTPLPSKTVTRAITAPSPSNQVHAGVVKGLAVGDKISDVKMLDASRSNTGVFKFSPTEKGGFEDLINVYSPRLSRLIMKGAVENGAAPSNSGDDASVLLTSYPGGVIESLVLFGHKSQTVDSIQAPNPLSSGVSPLLNLGLTGNSLDFTISVDPTSTNTGNGVEVIIKDAPSGATYAS